MGHGGETGGRLSSPSGVVTSHGGKQRAAGRATPVICVFYIYGVHLPKLERRPQTLRDNILPLDLDLDTQVQSTRLCRRRGLCVTLCFCSQTKGNSSFEMKSGGKTCKAEKLVKRTLFNWFRRGRHLSLFCLCSNSCHYAFFCLFSSRYFISLMSGWESFKEFRGLWKETTWEERLCSLSNPFSCFFPFQFKRWIYFADSFGSNSLVSVTRQWNQAVRIQLDDTKAFEKWTHYFSDSDGKTKLRLRFPCPLRNRIRCLYN